MDNKNIRKLSWKLLNRWAAGQSVPNDVVQSARSINQGTGSIEDERRVLEFYGRHKAENEKVQADVKEAKQATRPFLEILQDIQMLSMASTPSEMVQTVTRAGLQGVSYYRDVLESVIRENKNKALTLNKDIDRDVKKLQTPVVNDMKKELKPLYDQQREELKATVKKEKNALQSEIDALQARALKAGPDELVTLNSQINGLLSEQQKLSRDLSIGLRSLRESFVQYIEEKLNGLSAAPTPVPTPNQPQGLGPLASTKFVPPATPTPQATKPVQPAPAQQQTPIIPPIPIQPKPTTVSTPPPKPTPPPIITPPPVPPTPPKPPAAPAGPAGSVLAEIVGVDYASYKAYQAIDTAKHPSVPIKQKPAALRKLTKEEMEELVQKVRKRIAADRKHSRAGYPTDYVETPEESLAADGNAENEQYKREAFEEWVAETQEDIPGIPTTPKPPRPIKTAPKPASKPVAPVAPTKKSHTKYDEAPQEPEIPPGVTYINEQGTPIKVSPAPKEEVVLPTGPITIPVPKPVKPPKVKKPKAVSKPTIKPMAEGEKIEDFLLRLEQEGMTDEEKAADDAKRAQAPKIEDLLNKVEPEPETDPELNGWQEIDPTTIPTPAAATPTAPAPGQWLHQPPKPTGATGAWFRNPLGAQEFLSKEEGAKRGWKEVPPEPPKDAKGGIITPKPSGATPGKGKPPGWKPATPPPIRKSDNLDFGLREQGVSDVLFDEDNPEPPEEIFERPIPEITATSKIPKPKSIKEQNTKMRAALNTHQKIYDEYKKTLVNQTEEEENELLKSFSDPEHKWDSKGNLLKQIAKKYNIKEIDKVIAEFKKNKAAWETDWEKLNPSAQYQKAFEIWMERQKSGGLLGDTKWGKYAIGFRGNLLTTEMEKASTVLSWASYMTLIATVANGVKNIIQGGVENQIKNAEARIRIQIEKENVAANPATAINLIKQYAGTSEDASWWGQRPGGTQTAAVGQFDPGTATTEITPNPIDNVSKTAMDSAGRLGYVARDRGKWTERRSEAMWENSTSYRAEIYKYSVNFGSGNTPLEAIRQWFGYDTIAQQEADTTKREAKISEGIRKWRQVEGRGAQYLAGQAASSGRKVEDLTTEEKNTALEQNRPQINKNMYDRAMREVLLEKIGPDAKIDAKGNLVSGISLENSGARGFGQWMNLMLQGAMKDMQKEVEDEARRRAEEKLVKFLQARVEELAGITEKNLRVWTSKHIIDTINMQYENAARVKNRSVRHALTLQE